MVEKNDDIIAIDGLYGVSNIATIVVYLITIIKALVPFISFKNGIFRWVGFTLFLQPMVVYKNLKTSVFAIYEIVKAMPDAIKEVADLKLDEFKKLIELVLIGIDKVELDT